MRRMLVAATALVIAAACAIPGSAFAQHGNPTVAWPPAPATTPTFSPAAGKYDAPQTVTITAEPNAVIRYTTDGSDPNAGSQQYAGPITVDKTTTFKAMSTAPCPKMQSGGGEGYNCRPPSGIATAAYQIEIPPVAAPTFSPAGTGATCQPQPMTVSITAPAGATVRYTTDGSEPTESSPAYSAPITVDKNATLKARAFAQGRPNSAVTTEQYSICPPVETPKVVVKEGKFQLLDKVYFDTGKDTIKPVSYDLLDQVATAIKARPNVKRIEIQGHTDSTGSKALNTKLSQARAESVKKYLVSKGVEPERLVAKGYGPTKPVEPNKTARGREANRRVEFVILEGEGAMPQQPEKAAPAPAPKSKTAPKKSAPKATAPKAPAPKK